MCVWDLKIRAGRLRCENLEMAEVANNVCGRMNELIRCAFHSAGKIINEINFVR